MISEELSRTEMMFGEEGINRLKNASVAVFGIGGVGGYVVEALARSGIGSIALIDADRVAVSNMNRQIVALHSTVGKLKTEAAQERVRDIAPDCRTERYDMFYLPENADGFDLKKYTYIADCVDTVTAKLELAVRAENAGVKIISCMGMGNKLDPTAIEAADIYDTSVCPLARVMRRELRARGVKSLKCVYSKEMPITPVTGKSSVPASNAFVPSAAGLVIAGEIVKDIVYGR